MTTALREERPKPNEILISTNPVDGSQLGQLHIHQPQEVVEAVRRARKGYEKWRTTPLEERARVLKRAQQILLEKRNEFAGLITAEMGRPRFESLALEVQACVDLIGYLADRAEILLRKMPLPLHHLLLKRRTSYTMMEPLGVMAVIAPWNWSMLIPLGCIVPAILAGNAVVFKPSELTPLVGEKTRSLFLQAGLPENVFQVVHGYAPTGRALVDSAVDKVFFTGSTEIGQKVMQQAAQTLKNVVLELGGSDPAIVSDDVDLDNCTSGILWGGFNNCGQNCNSIERVYVTQKNLGPFLGGLAEKVKCLRLGDGNDPDVDIGPLASKPQLAKMISVVARAKEAGAKIVTGGNHRDDLGPLFFEPTIILWPAGADWIDMEEVFGPILHVFPVEDEQEAVRMANRSLYGLAASVWTRNMRQGERIAKQIESGSVTINDSVVSFGVSEASWTGIKMSGSGWVHGQKGLEEMVNIKYIFGDRQSRMQKFWWFPYSSNMVEAMQKGVEFLFSQNLWPRIAAIPRTLSGFFSYLVCNSRRKDKL